MVQVQRFSSVRRAVGVMMVAGIALAACGSDSNGTPSGGTTTVAAGVTTTVAVSSTTVAATTTAAPTTTAGFKDAVLDDIAKMTDCGTLRTLVTISTGERDAVKGSGQKLYQDRIDASTARIAALNCPAA